jgi:hypothetical protein
MFSQIFTTDGVGDKSQEIPHLMYRHSWRPLWTWPQDQPVSLMKLLSGKKAEVLRLLSSSAALSGFPNYRTSEHRNFAVFQIWTFSTHVPQPCTELQMFPSHLHPISDYHCGKAAKRIQVMASWRDTQKLQWYTTKFSLWAWVVM